MMQIQGIYREKKSLDSSKSHKEAKTLLLNAPSDYPIRTTSKINHL